MGSGSSSLRDSGSFFFFIFASHLIRCWLLKIRVCSPRNKFSTLGVAPLLKSGVVLGSKCQVIWVTFSMTPINTQYILHGQVLEVVSCARYLGWRSLVTWVGSSMWTELLPPQIKLSASLGATLRLSPLQSKKWPTSPLFASAGVYFSSVGSSY